jgi:hypothetical protein
LAMILSVICSFPLAMILSLFCQLPFGHAIVCPLSVQLWPWYCLSFVSFHLAMILSVFCQLPFGHAIVCLLSVQLWPWYCLSFVSSPLTMIFLSFVSFPLAMILSVFCQLSFGNDIISLLSVSLCPLYCLFFFRYTASGYLFAIFKPLLHSCENCHMLVFCVLKWIQTVYIFRQYIYLLLINCEGKFAILWEFYVLFILLFLVVNNIWVDIINGRHLFSGSTFRTILFFHFLLFVFFSCIMITVHN